MRLRKSGVPSASQPTISASMMQGGRLRSAEAITAKRPEMSLPDLLRMVAP